MEKIIGDYLSSIELGGVQQHKNMAVFPLFTTLNHGPEYLTLKEALALGVLAITEISEGGSVPNLKAINKGDLPILLLDGEELAGAKQNRVLNTTILLESLKMSSVMPPDIRSMNSCSQSLKPVSPPSLVACHPLCPLTLRCPEECRMDDCLTIHEG